MPEHPPLPASLDRSSGQSCWKAGSCQIEPSVDIENVIFDPDFDVALFDPRHFKE